MGGQTGCRLLSTKPDQTLKSITPLPEWLDGLDPAGGLANFKLVKYTKRFTAPYRDLKHKTHKSQHNLQCHPGFTRSNISYPSVYQHPYA
jgi:hypothetical protein